MGSIWIDQACVLSLGGSSASGDWGDLIDRAPAMDSLANPCEVMVSDSSANATVLAGFVFSRTDKEEYRWISQDEAGRAANVWIDRACAERMGGASMSGDWKELNEIAPRFDAIPNPCG